MHYRLLIYLYYTSLNAQSGLHSDGIRILKGDIFNINYHRDFGHLGRKMN